MAVTTGKDTKTTSGSGKPSGGPGGPNGPNSGPSTGAGGQKNTSSPSASSSKPSSSPSKSSPSSSSGGKTSPTSKTSTSSPSSKTTSPSNPTGGSLQAPNRTASSSGITSRTPSQPSANDKLKQGAKQYGGAQTSMRNATVTKSAPSAKVTDPSRGLTGSPKSPMSGQGTSYKTPEAAKIGNNRAGNIIDRRGEYNFPNDPITEIDKAFGRLDRKAQDFWDHYDRDNAAKLAGDLRNPQEIREAVERVKQSLRTKAKDRETSALRNPIGNSPQSQLASSLGRIKASGLLPNTPVGPARQTSGLPNANTPLGLSGNYMGPPSISNVISPTQGLTGPRSPMSGQGTSYNSPEDAASAAFKQSIARALDGYNVPGARTVAQDPSIAGRAAQANRNYKTTSGPGGMVSRTYSDPDVAAAQQANQPSFTDRITRGLQGLNDSLQSAFGVPEAGPNRGLANPSTGEQLAAAASDAWNKIQSGAGSFIDNLMSQPLIGAETVAAGPMTVDGSILGENRVFGPQNISQAITGDYPRASFDAQTSIPTSMRVANPVRSVASTSPDQLAMEQITQDPTNRTLSSAQGRAAFKEIVKAMTSPKPPATGKQITDRIAPTLEERRQQVVADIQQGRKPGSMPPATGSEAVQTGPQPEMSPEDVLPPTPAVRSGVAVPGNIFNRSIADIRRDIAAASARARGLGDIAPEAPAPSRAPSPSVSGPGGAVSPSQDGNYPPDENFMQDDGQPQSIAELGNRYQYEKDRAVQGFKDLPGDLYNAIVNGDFRPYTGTENDKRGGLPQFPSVRQQAAPQMDDTQQAALIALLMSLLQQQSTPGSQADLINSTFI